MSQRTRKSGKVVGVFVGAILGGAGGWMTKVKMYEGQSFGFGNLPEIFKSNWLVGHWEEQSYLPPLASSLVAK